MAYEAGGFVEGEHHLAEEDGAAEVDDAEHDADKVRPPVVLQHRILRLRERIDHLMDVQSATGRQ